MTWFLDKENLGFTFCEGLSTGPVLWLKVSMGREKVAIWSHGSFHMALFLYSSTSTVELAFGAVMSTVLLPSCVNLVFSLVH